MNSSREPDRLCTKTNLNLIVAVGQSALAAVSVKSAKFFLHEVGVTRPSHHCLQKRLCLGCSAHVDISCRHLEWIMSRLLAWRSSLRWFSPSLVLIYCWTKTSSFTSWMKKISLPMCIARGEGFILGTSFKL